MVGLKKVSNIVVLIFGAKLEEGVTCMEDNFQKSVLSMTMRGQGIELRLSGSMVSAIDQ